MQSSTLQRFQPDSELSNISPDLVDRIKAEFERYGIGNTPLVPVEAFLPYLPVYGSEIYVKLEEDNGPGAVKARPALWMILEAEFRGELTREKVILESSSGNTGYGLAYYGRQRGHQVELVIPRNAVEKIRRIEDWGIRVKPAEADGTSDNAIDIARGLYEEDSNHYFYTNQYDNPANARAHYNTTSEEIWRQTDGRVTHLVVGVGTGGTIVGTGAKLKEFNPDVKVIAVQPTAIFHGFSGLKFLKEAKHPPKVYTQNQGVIDDVINVGDEEAFGFVEGLYNGSFLGGGSSVAALYASLETAKRLYADGKHGVIVTIFPDGKNN